MKRTTCIFRKRLKPRLAIAAASLSAIVIIIHVAPTAIMAPAENGLQLTPLTVDESVFHPGDILFRKGGGLISQVVLTTDNQSPYSHAGLVVPSDGKLAIAHVTPREVENPEATVRIDAISDFLAPERAIAGALYRVNVEDNATREKAAAIAKRYAAQGIRFDADFDLSTDGSLYCTELIWRAYLDAGLDLVDGEFDKLDVPLHSGPYILPSGLLRSPHVYLVKRFESERSVSK